MIKSAQYLTIIYCSCDRYKCLWPGFFHLFKKYFPEFKGSIILNSEKETYEYPGIKITRPACDMTGYTWSERLLKSLEITQTPFVLLWLDDFWLKSPIDLNVLQECVNLMHSSSKIKLFTFGWQPGNNKDDHLHPKFELRGRFAPYRVNAQIGLWRTDYLTKIIKSKETPWQFELNGSFRSSLYGGKLYSLKKQSDHVFDYDWGFLVIRGKINRKIADYFEQKENITIDFPYGEFSHIPNAEIPSSKFVRVFKNIRYGWEMIKSVF